MRRLDSYSQWVACACALAVATNVLASDGDPNAAGSAAFREIENRLKQAGAQAPELAQLQEDFKKTSAEEIVEYQHYLDQLPREKLSTYVQDLRLNAQYALGADSRRQPNVPAGTTFEFSFDQSAVFPGTTRKITVYVPAEYTEDKPACVYVGFDGLAFEVPTVFDNLIYKHNMPVTIAVGVAPGTVSSADPPHDPRFDRSVEFDSLSGNLGRFVLEEVLPEVERHKTVDGRSIHLSKDPNDRAVGGASTGAIAAFTLAWEHPDAFRRVFSAIGTYVGMRAGDHYAVLIRKTEPKPLRIFLQDGSHDELTDFLGEVGDWWLSNQTVLSAFEFAGYDVRHIFGEGSHDGHHAAAVFPDAMRYLWGGWPAPVARGQSKNVMLRAVSDPADTWQTVDDAETGLPSLTLRGSGQELVDWRGLRYQTDTVRGRLWLTLGSGKRMLLDSGLAEPTGIAMSPDGLWLAVAERKSHWGYSYRIRTDGSVDARARFYWFHVPDGTDSSGVANWVFDQEGHLFAATLLGVQVLDRNGRSRAILPLPDGAAATAVSFAGRDFDVLYVTSANHHLYKRNLRVRGVLPRAQPMPVPDVSPG